MYFKSIKFSGKHGTRGKKENQSECYGNQQWRMQIEITFTIVTIIELWMRKYYLQWLNFFVW